MGTKVLLWQTEICLQESYNSYIYSNWLLGSRCQARLTLPKDHNKLTFKYYQKHKWMNTCVLYIMENCAVICDHGAFSSFLKKNLFSESFRNSFYKDHMHYAQSRQIKMGLLRPNMLSTRANFVAVLASTWQNLLIAISISKQKNFSCCNL